MIKNLPATAGETRDEGSNLGFGKSPGIGKGNSLQCSFLENAMDRGAWQATVAQNSTWRSDTYPLVPLVSPRLTSYLQNL